MIYLICFTSNGFNICNKLVEEFNKSNIKCIGYSNIKYIKSESKILPLERNVYEWTESFFKKGNTLIFICAIGIAVRSISKFIENKKKDPAVLVIDEKGKFIIPILSGHIGGANQVAYDISNIMNITPVITTATDINDIFSVDVWAVKNNMYILNESEIKNISSALLDNKSVGLYSEFSYTHDMPDNFPKGLQIDENLIQGICISYFTNRKPFKHTLYLIPKCINIGMGCKKDSSIKAVEYLFINTLEEYNISIYAVNKLCTIDIKKNEKAFNYISNKYNISFEYYSKEQLLSVPGQFTSSKFVESVTGVDNICERASAFGEKGKIICNKKSHNGVTISLFLIDYEVRF